MILQKWKDHQKNTILRLLLRSGNGYNTGLQIKNQLNTGNTHNLWAHFFSLRLIGILVGEMKHHDDESELKERNLDNERLSEMLDKAYIPSKDLKIGVG